MSSSQQEYLFFDTFAHDGEIDEILQVDEIKFDQPVYIDEIRVVPAGYNVNGLDKSASRIGATKPMPCELEFFGKNLNARSNRDRVRYRRFGKKTFRDENDMAYFPSLSIPVDSVVLKGKYDAVTLAVIGVLARPKSPPIRHDPASNNRQIVDFLQSAPTSHRAHPMDTLQLPMVAPSVVTPGGFVVQQQNLPPSVIDNASSSAHADGVWVAPPEQQQFGGTQQQGRQPQTQVVTGSFSHLQPQRPTPTFAGPQQSRSSDEHLHDYGHPPSSSSQPTYSSNRLDDQPSQLSVSNRPQPAPTFSSRTQTRTNYSPSDYSHRDKSLDELDEKLSRVSTGSLQHRPNIPEHINDEFAQLSSSGGASIITPSFSHLSHHYNTKKDEDHHFLHPSCMGDNHRRMQEPHATNTNQQNTSDADSYMSDDNTSESEASSIHGLLFNDDEQQAFKRDALYNTRGSTRFAALKTFHSGTKTTYEIECEKAHYEKYRHANEELVLQLRKLLAHASIDHCDVTFLESLELICLMMPIALACLDSDEELGLAVQRLTDWALKLIDIEYVMNRQFTELKDTLLKIRAIKCGIRLCGHLSVLTEEMANDWVKNDYQSKLLDLYNDECLAPSVKLLILKILDQSLFFKSGLLWFGGQHPDFSLTTRESPYFRLVQKLKTGTEPQRQTTSIGCLLTKVHLNEEFLSVEIQLKTLSSDESSLSNVAQSEIRKPIFDTLLVSLSSIRDVLINSDDLISQPKSLRIAPLQPILSVVYSKMANSENPWPSILRMMHDTDFIKSLIVLIHFCVLNQRQDIFNVIEDILRQFLNTLDGLVFLANQTSTPSVLLRALYFGETKFDTINNDPVGSQLMCALQTLTYVDELKLLSLKDDIEIDDSNVVQVLHCLLSLILFHHYVRKLSYKRRIIVRVLAMESNLIPLLHFIDISSNNDALNGSVQTRYIARIIYELLATPDSIMLLEQYGLRLLDLCEKHSTQRLVRLRTWLQPLTKIKRFDHTHETAEALMTELKYQLSESAISVELSPGLITVLRIMQYLCLPAENQFIVGAKIELKFDYMLLKLYSHGIYPLLINILEKCADALLRTWQLGVPMGIPDRIVVYGVLTPALILFKTLIQKLTLDRKIQFVDISPVRAFFSIYAVTLCASPSTEMADIDLMRTNLIDALLVYTWSIQLETDQQVTVDKCAWTLVLREILRLTTLFPHSITSGVCLLTELLPIPLPHTVRQSLTENEVHAIRDDFHRFHTVMHCLWTSDDRLRMLIQTLCHTSNTIMQEILRRLCMQLIDLGPKLAKLVIKTLMDELISTWKNEHGDTAKPSKQSATRLIVFIASLVATRSGKCTLIALLNTSEEKSFTIMEDILEYLHIRAESNETCLCQEATMSIMQNLCDASLYLSPSKSQDDSLQFLANVIPNQQLLSQILTHILRVLGSTKQHQTWTQTTMALRTLISLAEHDFGLQMIRTALMNNKEVLCTLIAEMDLRFDKEQPDYLEAVSALMVFLQRIMTLESIAESPFIRTQSLPVSLFRELLGVAPNSESHLEKFLELINAVVTDEPSGNESKQQANGSGMEQNEEDQQCLQTLQKIFERGNSIIQLLSTNENETETPPTTALILPRCESIDVQFQNRLVFIVDSECTDDQRSSELYWLGIPMPALLDDVEYGQDETGTNQDEIHEKVKCDLEDLVGKYCGTFNFFEEYKKEIVDKVMKKRKSSPKKRAVAVEPAPNVDTSIITTASTFKGRIPWSAPMRGNRRNARPGGGGGGGGGNAGNGIQRRMDHFRNRPLNTSRPPSMHVDEFEKQFHDNGTGNGSGGGNSSSSTNNNNSSNSASGNNNNSGANNANEVDLLSGIQSPNDGGSERDRWSRRGVTLGSRVNPPSNHRYPLSSNSFPYSSGGFSLRDRLPYGHPSSRYNMLEMDFPPPYFGGDELLDDRSYDYFPMGMPFEPVRYRSHFGRYDPAGFLH